MTILEDVSLAQYTTLGVGGAARWFVETRTEDEIVEAVGFARRRGVPLFVLGDGSNLLVSDAGFAGVVVRVAAADGVRDEREDESVVVTVGAGAGWDDLVLHAVERGYAGIECLAGIPGSVGGTPVQNVGAYGQEVSETIVGVRAFDLEAGAFVELEHAGVRVCVSAEHLQYDGARPVHRDGGELRASGRRRADVEVCGCAAAFCGTACDGRDPCPAGGV